MKKKFLKRENGFSHLKHNLIKKFLDSSYLLKIEREGGRKVGKREGRKESRSEGKKERIYIKMILEGKGVCSRTALRCTSAE